MFDQDQLLLTLNQALKEELVLEKDEKLNTNFPIIFVMGIPRSGTTPLSQILLHRFKVGYISNLIANFWLAPEYGIALTKKLSKDPGNESFSVNSDYGFTKGYEGHHEFGYFWQYWFNFNNTHYLDDHKIKNVNVPGFKQSLARMERIWDRPLFFKNAAALPLQTEFLANVLPKSIFIFVTRDSFSIAKSIMRGRKKYFDNMNKWFSIKPMEYEILKNKSIPEQIAGQVFYTERTLNQQLVKIPDFRKHCVSFEKLCLDTKYEIRRIEKFLKSHIPNIETREIEIPKLTPPSHENDSSEIVQSLEYYLKRLYKSAE